MAWVLTVVDRHARLPSRKAYREFFEQESEGAGYEQEERMVLGLWSYPHNIGAENRQASSEHMGAGYYGLTSEERKGFQTLVQIVTCLFTASDTELGGGIANSVSGATKELKAQNIREYLTRYFLFITLITPKLYTHLITPIGNRHAG